MNDWQLPVQRLGELYVTGKTRRIGADHAGKCVRVLQVAGRSAAAGGPENRRIPLSWPAPEAETLVCALNGNYRITFGWSGELATDIDFEDSIREEAMERKNGLPPVHPGRIIKEDILPSVGLSVTATAKALGVSRQMLHDILAERRPLSAVMCLKVARLFGSSPEVWMRLQAAYDVKKAEQNKKVMARVARIVPAKAAGEVRAKPTP